MVSARLQKVVSWVEGLKVGERNVIAALREIISVRNAIIYFEKASWLLIATNNIIVERQR